ncbi:MAG: D-aminoacyl-tRNA deacylase [Eubacteriales bacterium]|nr:D-aminoacyl-tRNA deacylase [Eubacteriales bacterium]MDD3199507.1 D-aminoacyl-tRNA deacylase [Eubacteriales bacterium]MDD4122296.1 D-aminoacyl-tRNA deacylase [Eubacteriales bacterium]MDD4630464.1 D-aminoacyl-tRNA deacylase [Eubacteriales bacterium]
MRAVVQRVQKADVTVEDKVTGAIERGLMVLLGVEDEDEEKDAVYLADKIAGLRIFEDEEGKMNLSVKDVNGDILAVSQFTLFGDCRKGKRPSFIKAARPEKANLLYRKFVSLCQENGLHVEEGIFQAEMLVRIYNDGPVTILIDSKKLF